MDLAATEVYHIKQEAGKMLKTSAQRVQNVLTQFGHPDIVQELQETAHTAEEAARAIGCAVGQIVKSLVFKGQRSNQAFLLLVSGKDRVDLHKAAQIVQEPLKRADADWVKDYTGYAIGGVPPIGHARPLTTIMDSNLWQYPMVWAAAGHPYAVFPSTPDHLRAMTRALVHDIHLTQQ